MMKRKTLIISTIFAGLGAGSLFASDYTNANQFNPLQTGVNSLDIAPDARGASMGDLGVASDPDVNSQFWNSSKYAFAYSSAGVSLSYTPWLRKLVNDIALLNLTGYWKIGSGDNQALSASLRYFTLGEVTSGEDGEALMSLHPYEMSFDLGYSRKLSEKYSMGVVFRYIYSDLGFSTSESETQPVGASAFAADINGYLTTFPMVGRSECQWSFGWNLSNIGSKVNYDRGNQPAFLPAQLRLGTAFTFPLADYHLLSLNLDVSKILVPTMPRESDYNNLLTLEDQEKFEEAKRKWESMSSITGIFKSFTDAPRGFKEELEEIRFSIGAEYSYNDQFFFRAGYFYEHPNKGNRQYLGIGAGFALKVVRLDASYMVATAASSPLDQTLRFSLSFDMDGIKDLFGRRR